jgi:hypothetical protein
MKRIDTVLGTAALFAALALGSAAPTPALAAAKAAAPTTCADGTTSTATGKGACSGHGGVVKATAKCKDGTSYSGKEHQGACSGHGGVEKWLDGSKPKS